MNLLDRIFRPVASALFVRPGMVHGVVVAESHAAGEGLVAERALHLQVEVVVVHVVKDQVPVLRRPSLARIAKENGLFTLNLGLYIFQSHIIQFFSCQNPPRSLD